jgi:hypothetical protein
MSSPFDDAAQGQAQAASSSPEAAPKQSQPGWKRNLPAIVICLVLLRTRLGYLFTPLPVYDFMTYWAAGRLFLSGGSPYSARSMYAIERSLGWTYVQSLVLLNPPWALPIVALLGVLPFKPAHYAWLAASLLLEAIASIALWRYFGGEKSRQWMALVLLATFMPAGSAEHMGQITPLMLAVLTASLFALRRKNDLLAGVCLLTMGLKPHLVYLFLLALLLWTVQAKRWILAISAVAAYAVASTAAILYNRNLLDYFHGSAQAALDTDCGVGGVLRQIFGWQHLWLQFLPTAIGLIWFALYWRKHRRGWSWEERLPLVLLVSIATAPYSWAHDYVLALPAVIALAVKLSRTRTDWLIPAAFYLVVQIVIFTLAEPLSKAWMATASVLWLALYWAGMLHVASEQPSSC